MKELITHISTILISHDLQTMTIEQMKQKIAESHAMSNTNLTYSRLLDKKNHGKKNGDEVSL